MKTIKKYIPNERVFIIELILTTECNQACEYCICDIPSTPNKMSLQVTHIPYIVKLIQYILDNGIFGHDALGVSLLGGEPTVYPYLKYLHTSLSALGVPITVITNGLDVDTMRTLDLSETTIITTYHDTVCTKTFPDWYREVSSLDAKRIKYNILATEYNIESQIINYNLIKDDEPDAILMPISRFPEHPSFKDYEDQFTVREDLHATIEYTDGTSESKHLTDNFLRNDFNVLGYECETSILFINEVGNVYRCANDITVNPPFFHITDMMDFSKLLDCTVSCPYTSCGCGDKNIRSLPC